MSFEIPWGAMPLIAFNYVKFKTNQKRLRTDEKVIADTVYGKVKGVKWRSLYGGSEYYSFEGIPFAKPPVGELRFKAPVQPEPWTGVKRCTRTHAKPIQYNYIIGQVQGREDCLYLNVYTKQLNPEKPMPVMVWIYGGGFQMGEASRDLYGPDYIMMENVVFISIAYRLGPLGFLSLDDPTCEIPGNAGLKDQILALKWVQNNCHFFGGDPKNITVFGESAGGASAHYLMLTEQAKGLFHKVVLMSGCVMAPWANIPRLDWAYRLAKTSGYKGENNDQDVFAHLNELSSSKLLKNASDLLTMEERCDKRLNFSFGPCVEPYQSEQCVIPRPPLEMVRNNWGNDIPMLIGGNSFEGLIMFPEARKYSQLLNNLGEGECLPPLDANLSDEKRLEYGRLLKQEYFGDKEPSWKTILQYSDIFSYKLFWHGIHRTLLARRQYAKAPTYLYRFDFDSKYFNIMRIIMCGRKVRGTCHADELSYLFYHMGAKKLNHRSAEYTTIRRMVAMLVKFAECGDPNIPLTDVVNWPTSPNDNGEHHDLSHTHHMHWPPIHAQQRGAEVKDDMVFKCLNISDELEVIDLPEGEKLKLWDRMYEDKSLLY